MFLARDAGEVRVDIEIKYFGNDNIINIIKDYVQSEIIKYDSNYIINNYKSICSNIEYNIYCLESCKNISSINIFIKSINYETLYREG